MRAIIDQLLQEVEGLTADNIYSAGSITEDNIPATPFAVVRMGTATPGMGVVKRRFVTIDVHDEIGDYTQIDTILDAVYGRLDGVEHVKLGDSELILATWQSTSDDLYDPGFRTIRKNQVYEVVGTGV